MEKTLTTVIIQHSPWVTVRTCIKKIRSIIYVTQNFYQLSKQLNIVNINICGIRLLCSHERKKIPQLSIEYQIMPNDNIQYIHLIVTLVNGMIFRTAVDSHVAMQLCWLWKHFSSSSRIVMSGKSEKLQVEGSSFIMEMPSLQPECRKSQNGEETHYCLVFKIRFPLTGF